MRYNIVFAAATLFLSTAIAAPGGKVPCPDEQKDSHSSPANYGDKDSSPAPAPADSYGAYPSKGGDDKSGDDKSGKQPDVIVIPGPGKDNNDYGSHGSKDVEHADDKSGKPEGGDDKYGKPEGDDKSGKPKGGDDKYGKPEGDDKSGKPEGGDDKYGKPEGGDDKSGMPKGGDDKDCDEGDKNGKPHHGGHPMPMPMPAPKPAPQPQPQSYSPPAKAQAPAKPQPKIVYHYKYVDHKGAEVKSPKDVVPCPEEAPKPATPAPAPAPKPAPQPAPAPSYQPPAKAPTKPSGGDSSPAPYTPTGDNLIDQCVQTHNECRSNHGAGSVTWDEELASFAKSNGNLRSCAFAHSGGEYGENIAKGYSDAKAAILDWYKEGEQYNYASGDFSSETGHFTQMVWKGTNKIGCAWNDECNFLMCEYYPRGNVIGRFQGQVDSAKESIGQMIDSIGKGIKDVFKGDDNNDDEKKSYGKKNNDNKEDKEDKNDLKNIVYKYTYTKGN